MTIDNSWQASYAKLKKDYTIGDDAIALFAASLRFGLDDIQAVASEAITGGGDDKKCDFVYVDKERQIVVVAQCYVAQANKNAAPSNKASDLNTAMSWLLVNDIDQLPDGLRGRAEEVRNAIKNKEIRTFYVWFAHNLPGSKNVKDELKAVEAGTRSKLSTLDGGSEITVFSEEICAETLSRLYNQAERTVIVTSELTTIVQDAFEVETDDWTALSTVVSGKWLSGLYATYRTDLFSANLRGYLGSRQSDSNINNGIKSTAEDSPENFFVYNNGITALVIDYEIGKRRKNGRKLIIQGISIVNGAQTTGSIANSLGSSREELKVAIRFVKAKKDSIVANVVQYNNTQNKIQAADFRSTDPIQERLRAEFKQIPDAEYEGGRRGGASDIIKRSKFTLPSYTVGQALAAFHGDPVVAYDSST